MMEKNENLTERESKSPLYLLSDSRLPYPHF